MRYYANVKVTTIKGEITVAIELHNKTNTEVDDVTFEFVEYIIKKMKPKHWEILDIVEGKEAMDALGEDYVEKEKHLERLRKSYNRE